MRKLFSLLLCLAPAMAVAQNAARVGGPVSGFVFDRQARALRPMMGVPGASYLGAALAAEVDAAAVSPDGTLALAASQDRLTLVSGLQDLTPAFVAIEGAIGGVDRIVWSPDGALAAVYSSRDGRAQVLRKIAGKPETGAVVEAAGAITALAVSSAGELLAGAEDGVYLLTAGAAPRLVAAATRPSALAFRQKDLFVADSGADRILLVEDFAGSPAATTFDSGLGAPVGLQMATDGKRLFAAGARDRLLRAYDAAGRYAIGQVELDCTPSELGAFGGRDVWLLNSDHSGTEPLYVGTGAGDPAAWFVPAGREQ